MDFLRAVCRFRSERASAALYRSWAHVAFGVYRDPSEHTYTFVYTASLRTCTSACRAYTCTGECGVSLLDEGHRPCRPGILCLVAHRIGRIGRVCRHFPFRHHLRLGVLHFFGFQAGHLTSVGLGASKRDPRGARVFAMGIHVTMQQSALVLEKNRSTHCPLTSSTGRGRGPATYSRLVLPRQILCRQAHQVVDYRLARSCGHGRSRGEVLRWRGSGIFLQRQQAVGPDHESRD